MVSLFGVLVLCLGFSCGQASNNVNNLYMNFTNNVERFLETNKNGISPACKNHLLRYVDGIKSKEQWALRMLDAGAKIPPPGMLDGNVMDLGSFDECLNIEHRQEEVHVFGKYCIAQVFLDFGIEKVSRLQSKQFIVRAAMPRAVDVRVNSVMLAKCFPGACSTAEMEQATLSVLTGKSVFAGIFGVVILSTIYEIVLHYCEKKPAHSMLVAFSALNNGKKLINASYSSKEITCLHGIRAISTMWIILDHRYSIQFSFPMKNSFYHFNWVNDDANMFMLSATLAVDTFLLLSGSLIVYNYMNAMNKGTKFNVLLHYLHRYLRITPVLVVVMVFHITLLIHTGSGPFWPTVIQEQLVDGCEIHWWKTLLFVQNIFGRGKAMCIPQTWYLSTDMQLFIVSPFLLLPLKLLPTLALSVIGSLTVLSMLVGFLIAWFYNLNAFMQGNAMGKEMDYVWLYYFPMHTRAAPWLIGLILGYILFKTREGLLKFPKNKVVNLIMWATSLTILCTCVFAGHNLIVGEHDRIGNSIHIALVRPVWALAIAWIIFACADGRGGPVNWFLSLPTFQVVSKLTYCLYVVHYTLIYIMTAQMKTTGYFDNFQAMYKFWGDLAFAFVVSAILALAVEFPMVTIDRCLFGQRQKKGN